MPVASRRPPSSSISRQPDVFTLHTRYEGLSHVMLEAMHAGTPIVASDVGGNAEVIESGRNGLLVPLDDRATTLRYATPFARLSG